MKRNNLRLHILDEGSLIFTHIIVYSYSCFDNHFHLTCITISTIFIPCL